MTTLTSEGETHDVALRSNVSVDDKQSKKQSLRSSTKTAPVNFRRLQVTLSEHGFQRLEKLRQLTDVVSQADVVRDALSFYEAAVEEITAGRQCFFQDPKNPEDRGVRLMLRVR